VRPDATLTRVQRRFNAVVVGAVTLGFVILVAVGAYGVLVMQENLGFTDLVNHTYRVQAAIDDFRVLDERVETARRGFLLSHDPQFDLSAQATSRQLNAAVDRISALTADNAVQQANVTELRPLLAQQLQAVAVSLAFARAGNSDTSAFFRDAGVAATRDIRAVTQEMLDEEQVRLVTRNRGRAATLRNLDRVAVASAVLLALVAIASVVVILGYTRGLTASRRQLSELNADLEAQVATRTGDLVTINARLEALLHEVNHRVANSLQLVSAFVQMQAQASDGGARAALKDTQRRIEAIIQVHRRLYSSNDVESVDMQDYLEALVRELQDTLSSAASPRNLSLVADDVRLATDKAVSVGVIVNELITNACKYAYRRGEAGEVRVRLTDEGGGLTLIVEDDGAGMADGQPAKGTGLGGRVIRAMASSLNSEVVYDASRRGVRATLRLPAA
jgi:two-component sensor histidine kinase